MKLQEPRKFHPVANIGKATVLYPMRCDDGLLRVFRSDADHAIFGIVKQGETQTGVGIVQTWKGGPVMRFELIDGGPSAFWIRGWDQARKLRREGSLQGATEAEQRAEILAILEAGDRPFAEMRAADGAVFFEVPEELKETDGVLHWLSPDRSDQAEGDRP